MFLYKCKEALRELVRFFTLPPPPHFASFGIEGWENQNERIRLLAFVIIYTAGGWSDRHHWMTGGNQSQLLLLRRRLNFDKIQPE